MSKTKFECTEDDIREITIIIDLLSEINSTVKGIGENEDSDIAYGFKLGRMHSDNNNVIARLRDLHDKVLEQFV